jgi:hypothetical protein
MKLSFSLKKNYFFLAALARAAAVVLGVIFILAPWALTLLAAPLTDGLRADTDAEPGFIVLDVTLAEGLPSFACSFISLLNAFTADGLTRSVPLRILLSVRAWLRGGFGDGIAILVPLLRHPGNSWVLSY